MEDPVIQQLQSDVASLQSKLGLLDQSSTISRDQENSLRERLDINTIESDIIALQAAPAVEGFKTGDIKIILTTSVPSGWVACAGSPLSRTGNGAALFAVIGTTWGAGDGSTTFNVPNFNGLFLAQYGANSVTAIGTTGGEQTHTLTESELPTNVTTLDAVTGGGLSGTGNPSYGTGRTGGAAHNNMPPFAGVLFVIKL